MTNSIAGHCGKCGAPYTVPTIWHGITPPPMTPSCRCWNSGETTTTTGTYIVNRNAATDSSGDLRRISKLEAENERLRELVRAVIAHRDNNAFLNIDTWRRCVSIAEALESGNEPRP